MYWNNASEASELSNRDFATFIELIIPHFNLKSQKGLLRGCAKVSCPIGLHSLCNVCKIVHGPAS
ncbi:hypothetical protein QQP08_017918 [Theobroma cacao]|nr:hypothetical protein QQP08_017918 [Theobroma cacao]